MKSLFLSAIQKIKSSSKYFIFLIPFIIYLTLLLVWESKGYYNITGDEPHYLVTMDSIVHDFDFIVTNNYVQETVISEAFGSDFSSHAYYSPSGYSIHGVGIAILLSIPYLVAGVIGVKIALVVFFGITIPWLSYQVLYKITELQKWSIATALGFSCSLPFYAASNQIFPDLVAGVFILHTTYFFILCELKQKNARSWIISLIFIAFLPWLKLSFILPFFILSFYGIYVIIKNRGISIKILFLMTIPFFSVVLLLFYNHNAFSELLNPYGKTVFTYTINDIGLAFLGLIYDQKQGALLQNSLLLLSFLGFFPFFKKNKEGFILVVSLYLSVTLPNSMLSLPNLYGGLSFLGRFTWSSIGLWLFPLAYAVVFIPNSKILQRFFAFALCINTFIQVLFYRVALTHNHFLYNTNVQSIESTTNNLYQEIFSPVEQLFQKATPIKNILPYYHDPVNYAKHIPNYLFLLLSFSLVLLGKKYYDNLTKTSEIHESRH